MNGARALGIYLKNGHTRLCPKQNDRNTVCICGFDQAAVELKELEDALGRMQTEVWDKAKQIANLCSALAKCNPWKQKDNGKLYCAFCGHMYSVANESFKDDHEKDCIWVTAIFQTGIIEINMGE